MAIGVPAFDEERSNSFLDKKKGVWRLMHVGQKDYLCHRATAHMGSADFLAPLSYRLATQARYAGLVRGVRALRARRICRASGVPYVQRSIRCDAAHPYNRSTPSDA